MGGAGIVLTLSSSFVEILNNVLEALILSYCNLEEQTEHHFSTKSNRRAHRALQPGQGAAITVCTNEAKFKLRSIRA